MFRRILINSFVILALISLTGCSQNGWRIITVPTETNAEDILRIVYMSDEICDPPCWMGITPFETTYEEALEIIGELNFFSNEGLINIDENLKFINWYGGDGNNAHIRFTDGIVSSLSFSLRNAQLGDVIQTYGFPEYYNTQEGDSEYGIDIFYPKVGLVFGGYDTKLLSESTTISGVFFVHPDTADNFFDDYINLRRSLHPRIIYDERYYPWEGLDICPKGLSSDYFCKE